MKNLRPCRVNTKKAESLKHISVGQRPTLGDTIKTRLKALCISPRCRVLSCTRMHKAFSLGILVSPLRRALPYANIRKAVGLVSLSQYVPAFPSLRSLRLCEINFGNKYER